MVSDMERLDLGGSGKIVQGADPFFFPPPPSPSSAKFKVPQLAEALYDPKTWVLVGTSVLLNAGASVTGTFGGLLIKGLGFDNYHTVLLNMPFGGVQFMIM